jgi:anti-sigma factor RsiW
MNDVHAGDRAALYALGALSDDESAALQAHLRSCPECARAVGAAERDVEALVALQPRREPPPELAARIDRALRTPHQPNYWPTFAALAAAFFIGILPSLYFWQANRTMHETVASQAAAMERLAAAPHRTATFTSNGGALAAHVMYAPDGSWYVVLINGVSRTLDVAWMHDGARTMLGSATPHGGLAMLYLPKSHRMNQLALMDGERIVAQAQLPY